MQAVVDLQEEPVEGEVVTEDALSLEELEAKPTRVL